MTNQKTENEALNKADPKDAGRKPPFPEKPQSTPGSEWDMNIKPDHGEASYRGYRRLEGKTAIVTGGDSGIGRAVAIA